MIIAGIGWTTSVQVQSARRLGAAGRARVPDAGLDPGGGRGWIALVLCRRGGGRALAGDPGGCRRARAGPDQRLDQRTQITTESRRDRISKGAHRGPRILHLRASQKRPALRDEWYPWVLAFGLAREVDDWSTQRSVTGTGVGDGAGGRSPLVKRLRSARRLLPRGGAVSAAEDRAELGAGRRGPPPLAALAAGVSVASTSHVSDGGSSSSYSGGEQRLQQGYSGGGDSSGGGASSGGGGGGGW